MVSSPIGDPDEGSTLRAAVCAGLVDICFMRRKTVSLARWLTSKTA